jgi:hypothetical protein
MSDTDAVATEQVEVETNAVLKHVLSHIESSARLQPEEAAHPHRLNEVRRQVIRRVWALVRLASRATGPVE